ncbi:hypothetical protein KAS08_00250 [Candidatus Pacearchaeota archaeon]|nr:hypothetical protein [Candidatus Pacearchaeota archaeon]
MSTGKENIANKFGFLKMRLDETSVLMGTLPKSGPIIKIFLKNIKESLKEITEDAKIASPGILLEIQEFEIRLNEISDKVKISR